MFNFESTQTHMKEVPVALFLPFSPGVHCIFLLSFLSSITKVWVSATKMRVNQTWQVVSSLAKRIPQKKKKERRSYVFMDDQFIPILKHSLGKNCKSYSRITAELHRQQAEQLSIKK